MKTRVYKTINGKIDKNMAGPLLVYDMICLPRIGERIALPQIDQKGVLSFWRVTEVIHCPASRVSEPYIEILVEQ